MLRGVDIMARRQDIKKQSIQQLSENRLDQYVGLCTIARDEHLYIREWIMYHKYIGVSKFYVYDHTSIPPMKPLLQDFINSGLIEYTYLKLQWLNDDYNLDARPVNYLGKIHANSPQRWTHIDCLKKHGNNHQFMALIDLDEFIVLNQGKKNNYQPVKNPDLPRFLEKYNQTGGVFMQYRFFGSNGHVSRPEGLVLKNYLKCETYPRKAEPQNPKVIKQMVNMRYFLDMCLIHTCFTTKSGVTADYKKFRATDWIDNSWEGISLHHYIYKSLEDFQNKLQRGGGHSDTVNYKQYRTLWKFHNIDNNTKGDCSYMAKIADDCCQEQSSGT